MIRKIDENLDGNFAKTLGSHFSISFFEANARDVHIATTHILIYLPFVFVFFDVHMTR